VKKTKNAKWYFLNEFYQHSVLAQGKYHYYEKANECLGVIYVRIYILFFSLKKGGLSNAKHHSRYAATFPSA
jgi:hypothetical protein